MFYGVPRLRGKLLSRGGIIQAKWQALGNVSLTVKTEWTYSPSMPAAAMAHGFYALGRDYPWLQSEQ
jgi:hypothetical protein